MSGLIIHNSPLLLNTGIVIETKKKESHYRVIYEYGSYIVRESRRQLSKILCSKNCNVISQTQQITWPHILELDNVKQISERRHQLNNSKSKFGSIDLAWQRTYIILSGH